MQLKGGNDAAVREGQTGDKLGTNWGQTGDKLGTNWGHKEMLSADHAVSVRLSLCETMKMKLS